MSLDLSGFMSDIAIIQFPSAWCYSGSPGAELGRIAV